jgi:hypothetical protein
VLIDSSEKRKRYHDLRKGHYSAHVGITITVYPNTPLVQKNDDHLASAWTLIVMSNVPKRDMSAVVHL